VLVIAGGFCYFGYFLARMLATSREMLDAMLRLEQRLEAVGPVQQPITRTVAFVATKSGTMFHRPDCPTVANKPPAELRSIRTPDSLTPCRICTPDN